MQLFFSTSLLVAENSHSQFMIFPWHGVASKSSRELTWIYSPTCQVLLLVHVGIMTTLSLQVWIFLKNFVQVGWVVLEFGEPLVQSPSPQLCHTKDRENSAPYFILELSPDSPCRCFFCPLFIGQGKIWPYLALLRFGSDLVT